MKKLLLFVAPLFLCSLTFAQKDLIGDLFEKYSGKEGFTIVNISGDMLKMMTDAHQQTQDTVLSSKITELRILALEKGCDKPATIDFRSEVLDKLDKALYKEMINVKQEGEDVVIMMKESNGRISEILVIAGGNDDNALIQVKGDMLLNEMAQMMGKYHMKGFNHFK